MEWIPINENPKKDGEYLVSMSIKGVVSQHLLFYYYGEGWVISAEIGDTITHWMEIHPPA